MARRGLTRELIVDLAVAIADAEGLAAVSMNRLGAELGVTPMSLYRYVDSKHNLETAMAERVLEDLDLPVASRSGDSWADMARRVVYAWAELVARHPGSVRLVYGDRPVTRTDMLPVELFVQAALSDGFTPQQAAMAYRTVVLFVDSVLVTTNIRAGVGTASWADLPAELAQTLPGVRIIAGYADPLTYRELFDNGVELLLAGIAQRVGL
jgi:AcrR family transcriptional regulator